MPAPEQARNSTSEENVKTGLKTSETVISERDVSPERQEKKVGSSFQLKNLNPFNKQKAKDNSSYQLDNLEELRLKKDDILNNYLDNSEMYDPTKYGDTYSDDENFIFDEDLRKPPKRARVRTRTLNSSSGTSSPTETSSANSAGENAVDSKNPYYNCKYLKKNERLEAAERGEALGENDSEDEDEDFISRLKRRYRKAKNRSKEAFGTMNCQRLMLLISLIIIISVLSFIVPFIARSNRFPHHEAPPLVFEHISDYIYPQLSGIRTNMVDEDTPREAYVRKNRDGEDWELVFSDEFNAEGRTFYPGMDQFWEAVDLHYAATRDLEWYDPDAVITSNGTLNLRMDVLQNHGLFYRSGMLQSWNKMCHSEGIVEISAKLPGSSLTAGLWPGLWTLGNLARPGYMATTDGVWPYSYDECDAGITANQSSDDGLSQLPGQKLNKCTCKGEDHPNRGVGRGAPEIDLLEGAHSTKVIFGVASQTLQVAPFDIWYQPDYDFIAIHNLSKSNQNSFRGTPFQEMVSTITTINETWFQYVVDPDDPNIILDDQTYFQKYAVEYLSKVQRKEDAYVRFFLGDEPTVTIEGSAMHPDGNIGWRDMPKEPMSMVLNLGLSTAWSQIDWFHINFPVTFEIDYVRIYQPKLKTQLTCDPGDFPTGDYIERHKNAYMNPNLTTWEQAGYEYPKNKLVHHC